MYTMVTSYAVRSAITATAELLVLSCSFQTRHPLLRVNLGSHIDSLCIVSILSFGFTDNAQESHGIYVLQCMDDCWASAGLPL